MSKKEKEQKVDYIKLGTTFMRHIANMVDDLRNPEIVGDMEDELESFGFVDTRPESEMTKAKALSILNLNNKSTKKEIESRYKFLVKVFHPDRFKTEKDKKNAEVEMQAINKAYEFLKSGDGEK